jgi:predicted DNA-binding transcriptional regulator YafY
MEGYRTNLTGLTQDEVKALFMLSVPASLDKLGVSQDLQSALRKLGAALPTIYHGDEEMVRRRIYLDWNTWSQDEESTTCLQIIHQAIWENRKLYLVYRQQIGPLSERFERMVDPIGLVAKGEHWYLVCSGDDRIRVHQISQILKAHISDEHFERPKEFELTRFWKSWCKMKEERRPSYRVTIRVSPNLVQFLPLYFNDRIPEAIASAGAPDGKGWVTLILPFESLIHARERILGFGGAVEVLEPEALRLSVVDFAEQIVDCYKQRK